MCVLLCSFSLEVRHFDATREIISVRSRMNERTLKIDKGLLFAAESGGPVANTSDRIVGQFVWTGVLGPDHQTVHHFRAGDEFSAGIRVREIALIEASNGTLAREKEFPVVSGLADHGLLLVFVIIVVDNLRSSRSRRRVLLRSILGLWLLSISGNRREPDGSPTRCRVCSRC